MQPKSLELDISQEQLDRIARTKASREGVKVDPEWLFIAEFGYYFGYEGIRALRNDEITLEEATMMLQGAIKVWYGKLVQQSHAQYVANVAAQSKKGSDIMAIGLREYTKNMKADL